MSVIGRRLRELRLRHEMSQEQLGIEAELDPMSARVRMNRYENDRRVPNPDLVVRFARVLKVPAAYFYCEDDEEAQLLLAFHRLSKQKRQKLIALIASQGQ
jgi:transcriptional regulator with XRE-family HTH domain